MRHLLKSNTHSTVGLIHSDFPSEGSAVRTRVLPQNTSLTAGYFYFMFTTYILYSLVRDRYYIGFTSGDLGKTKKTAIETMLLQSYFYHYHYQI